MTQIIKAGRAAVSRHLLLDACRVETQTTSYADGVLSDDDPVVIFEGGCRVKPVEAADLQVADGQYDTYMYHITLPHDVDGVKPGNVVTITSSSDGDLQGAVFVVVELPHASTFSILRRLLCRRIETDQP